MVPIGYIYGFSLLNIGLTDLRHNLLNISLPNLYHIYLNQIYYRQTSSSISHPYPNKGCWPLEAGTNLETLNPTKNRQDADSEKKKAWK